MAIDLIICREEYRETSVGDSAVPLGTVRQVKEIVEGWFPGVEWDSEDSAIWDDLDSTITFDLGGEACPQSIMIQVSGRLPAQVFQMCQEHTWVLVECGSGSLFTNEE